MRLAGCAAGTAVAIEATANWYWIIDEIEQAGLAAAAGASAQSEVDDGADRTRRIGSIRTG